VLNEELTTKLKIVNTAVDLIKEHGYSAVSINQICDALGITRSAYYYYFKTKDEVFDSYLLFPESYVYENVLPSMDGMSYKEQFYKVFELFSQMVVEVGPDIVRFVFKRNIDAKVQNLAPRDITMWKTYTDIIRKAQQAGEIRIEADADNITEAVFHMVNGIGVTWCNKKCNFDYAGECQRMIDLILGW